MKERKGFKGFVGKLFDRKPKMALKPGGTVKFFQDQHKGVDAFYTKNKKGRKYAKGAFGKPGQKSKALSKSMRSYIVKMNRRAYSRFGRNKKAATEFLKADKCYMACVRAMRSASC